MWDSIATSSITLEIFAETSGIILVCGSLVGIVVGILAYLISNN
jgi:hypothetical protein